MTTQADRTRQFTCTKKAWYAQPAVDKSGMYTHEEFGLETVDEHGVPTAQVCVRWDSFGGGRVESPRLEAYGDAWHILPHFADVFATLSRQYPGGEISAQQFHKVLSDLKVYDATPVRNPREDPQSVRERGEDCAVAGSFRSKRREPATW